MRDDHPESFDLPEWGTGGAPPEPVTEEDEHADEPTHDVDLLIDVEAELIEATIALPDRYRMREVIGLVAAEGSASVSDDTSLQSATGAARSAAFDRLTSEARMLGANAVAGIRLSVTVRLNEVVVVAYGTALVASPR